MPELIPVEHDPFTPMRMTPVEHDPFMVSPAVIDTMRAVPFDYGRQPDNAGPLARVGPLSQQQTDYARALINTPRIPGQNGGPSLEPIEPMWQGRTPSFAEALSGGIQRGLMAGGMDTYDARHFGNAASSLGSAFPGIGIPMAADELYGAAQNRDPLGGAVAAVGLLPMAKGALTAARGAASEVVPGIRAYHGSPHDFDRFSLDKIGTGEGAQAYGHGLYFAEGEGVAKSYRDTLSRSRAKLPDDMISMPPDARRALMTQAGTDADPMTAARWAQNMHAPLRASDTAQLADIIDRTRTAQRGKMYEVNIKADPEHFLDWDKPLSEQSQHVQDALKGRDIPKSKALQNWESNLADTERTLEMIKRQPASPSQEARLANVQNDRDALLRYKPPAGVYEALGSPQEAAQILRDAGIPGIRYLDQGSRRPTGSKDVAAQLLDAVGGDRQKAIAEAEKRLASSTEYQSTDQNLLLALHLLKSGKKVDPITRNYVAFDDRMIDIIKKYGIAGLMGGAAAYGALGAGKAKADTPTMEPFDYAAGLPR